MQANRRVRDSLFRRLGSVIYNLEVRALFDLASLTKVLATTLLAMRLEDAGRFSRIDPSTGREILVTFNTSTSALQANIEVDARTTKFTALRGNCGATPNAPGSYRVSIAALSYVICQGH